jgi:hypothetical protein
MQSFLFATESIGYAYIIMVHDHAFVQVEQSEMIHLEKLFSVGEERGRSAIL